MAQTTEAKSLFGKKLISIFESSAKQIDHLIEKSFLPEPLKNKGILGGILLVIVILLLVLFSGGSGQNLPTYKVTKGDFLVSITENGEIRARNSKSISAPRIRGNLKIVYLIPEGTYVHPGDVICKFDPSEVMTSLRDAETKLELALSNKDKTLASQKATLAQMESDYKSAELSFELSKLKLEQVKFEAEAVQQQAKLEHEKNILSFEKAKQERESKKIILKSEMNVQDVEIRQRQSDVEKAKKDMENLTVKTPSEGLAVYGQNWANQGRKFAIGDAPWGGMEIVSLPDLSSMESLINVNEVDVSKVKPGQKVLVRLDAFQDSTFSGTITHVASIGKNKETNSNIKVFEVLIEINERSDILRPGMTTSNKLIINEIPDCVYVPYEAVFDKDDNKIVYVKNGSDFDERAVELGEKGEDYIVVRKGLLAGEEVSLVDPALEPASSDSEKQKDINIPANGN